MQFCATAKKSQAHNHTSPNGKLRRNDNEDDVDGRKRVKNKGGNVKKYKIKLRDASLSDPISRCILTQQKNSS